MNYFLEIEAEGLPRNVGPFTSREAAESWAAARVANGSWSVVPLSPPYPPEDTHAAVYCPECGVKVKYRYPRGASLDARDEAILAALTVHYSEVAHR